MPTNKPKWREFKIPWDISGTKDNPKKVYYQSLCDNTGKYECWHKNHDVFVEHAALVEAERTIAELEQLRVQCVGINEDLHNQNDLLTKRIGELEGALKQFADKDNYYRTPYCNESHFEGGQKLASEALAKLTPKSDGEGEK